MITLPKWDKHANDRKEEWNITEAMIAETWLFGEPKRTRDWCWFLIGPDITLVLSPNGDFIITMFPNKGRHREKALNSLQNINHGKPRQFDSLGRIKK